MTRKRGADRSDAGAPEEGLRTVLLVGVTGGIASGKTEVDRILQSCGARIVDADAIVHRLLAGDEGLRAGIEAAFGRGVIAPDGTVDRTALGRIVFHDTAARERLNGMVHPLVRRAIGREVEATRREDGPAAILVVDAALMVESGFHRAVDRLVVVTAPVATRLRRLALRDGLDPAEASARIAAQGPEDAKLAAADYIVVNDGSRDELAAQVRVVWTHLLDDLRRKDRGAQPASS